MTNMCIYGGMQQIGIGTYNGASMHNFYSSVLGFDTPMFYEEGTADLMLPYTGGRSWKRKTMLIANLHGGATLELCQYTDRPHVSIKSEAGLDNIGILCACVRCRNIERIRNNLLHAGHEVTHIAEDVAGRARIYVRDPEYNWIGLVETPEGWLIKKTSAIGGVCSVIIGVSDMEKSIHFYSTVCGYDVKLYDEVGVFAEFDAFRAQQKIRRVILTSSAEKKGVFAHLLQSSTIELIQAFDKKAEEHIYENYKGRFWGDPGFIHVCFDIANMNALKTHCKASQTPFIVDSGQAQAFSIEETSGRFAYVEDPDRTLVEFVEVYRLPIIKKYGLILNLQERKNKKPLPKVFMRLLALKKLSRKKF